MLQDSGHIHSTPITSVPHLFEFPLRSDTEHAVMAVLKSLGPAVEHHNQLDAAWLQTRNKSALEALARAGKALSSSAYTREERRAHKRQTKANKRGR